MKTPILSIIMSVHNDERFVGEAVASVLGSSFTDLEFLVTDDGSTDGTPAILSQFNDERLTVIQHTKNQGLTSSLIEAIARSHGQYIARMDSDDVSLPSRFERQVAFLEEHPDYALVGCRYVLIDEEGHDLATVDLPETNAEITTQLLSTNPFCHGATMFRRSVIDEVGSYRPEFRYAQDYDLWLRINEHFNAHNLPDYLYKWRIRLGSIAVGQRHKQKAFGQLSRTCAVHRRAGKSEPDLGAQVDEIMRAERGTSLWRGLRPADRYDLIITRILLENGDGAQARRRLGARLRTRPYSPVTYLLMGGTLIPAKIVRIMSRWIANRLRARSSGTS